MPSVFLSYSREDLLLIEQLEAQLKTYPKLSIWRDQDKIYGGQKWPKVLGEAISNQDVFLLAWSKNSAASHFVEFEWCTAIALKKTIVPCLLDDTPLAPSLATFHGYPARDLVGLTNSLAGAPLADQGRRTPVLRKLTDITAIEESAVLAQAKSIFAQQQWTVQGNVYQAGGDIHIHTGSSLPNHPAGSPEGARKRYELMIAKWQTWVVIVGVILAIVLAVLQIQERFWPLPGFMLQRTSAERTGIDAGSTSTPHASHSAIREGLIYSSRALCYRVAQHRSGGAPHAATDICRGHVRAVSQTHSPGAVSR